MPLAATASVSPVCCVVCLSFWPVFRSLPVCWSAFILAFFLILLVNLFWSLISFLSSHLSTSHSYLTFVILFSPPTFSFSFSAPFLSFSFFSPPTYNSHFFPHHPCLLPPLCGTWCWGVAEVQWTALPSAVELSPGPSGAQCVYVLQEMFFLNQQLQSRTCTAASDLGIHAHTVHTFQNQCWSKIALKEQRGDGVVLL